MWKAVQTVGIFEDDNEEFFEDGSNPVLRSGWDWEDIKKQH